MFPSQFDGIENEDALIAALRVMCIKSGFHLVQRSFQSQKQLSQFHTSYITLCCQQCVVYKDQRNKKERKTYTKWCINLDDKCNFGWIHFSAKSQMDSFYRKKLLNVENLCCYIPVILS